MMDSFPTHLSAPLPPAQGPPFADPHGDAPGVEELEQRDRVLAGDAEQVLDVPGADLLALAEQRDQLLLDRLERPRVEEEGFLDADERAALHEHLEELVLLVAPDPGVGERLLRARRARRRPG